MVAEKSSARLVPASYLDGASCLLPRRSPISTSGIKPNLPGLPAKGPATVEGQVSPSKLLARLSLAERLVAIHVAQGLSNKEISSALNRAEPTIKHQISSVMRKLGVQSRCQLIVRLLT